MRYRAKDRLTAADIGKRVTVRHALVEGGSTDVLGELLSVGDVFEIRRKDGTVAIVSADSVIAARVHPTVL